MMRLTIKNKTSPKEVLKSISLRNGGRYQLLAGDSVSLLAEQPGLRVVRKKNDLIIRTSNDEEFVLENFFTTTNASEQQLLWHDASGAQHLIASTDTANVDLLSSEGGNTSQVTMVSAQDDPMSAPAMGVAPTTPASVSPGALGLLAVVGGVAAAGGGGGGGGGGVVNVLNPISTPLGLSLANNTGSSASGNVTNNATINVQGLANLAAGVSWQYQVDGGTWQTGSGANFTATSGTHSYFVRQVDANGSPGPASLAAVYILDTSAPDAISAVGASASVAAGSRGTITLTANLNNAPGESSAVTWALGAGADTALFSIDPTSGVLSFNVSPSYQMPRGAPINAITNPSIYYVYVTATDAAGNVSVPTAVEIRVADVNLPPTAQAISAQTGDQAVLVGEVFSLDVSASFIDPNQQDVLTYRATGLPNGLTINTSTGVIGGTATVTTDSPVTVTVTATDGGGLSTTQTFNLEVDNPTIVTGLFQGGPVLKGAMLTVQAVDAKGNAIKDSTGKVITAPVSDGVTPLSPGAPVTPAGTYSLNLGNNVGTKVADATTPSGKTGGVVTVKLVDMGSATNTPAYYNETTGPQSAGNGNFTSTVVVTKGATQTANVNAITTIASKVITSITTTPASKSVVSNSGSLNGFVGAQAIEAVASPAVTVSKALVNNANTQVGKTLLGTSTDVTQVTPTLTVTVSPATQSGAPPVVTPNPAPANPTPTQVISSQAGKALTVLSTAQQLPNGKAVVTNVTTALQSKVTSTSTGTPAAGLVAGEEVVSSDIFLTMVASIASPAVATDSTQANLDAAIQALYVQAGARVNAVTDAGITTGMSASDVDALLQAVTPVSVLILAGQDIIPKNNGVPGTATVRFKFAQAPDVGTFTERDLAVSGGTLSDDLKVNTEPSLGATDGTLYIATFNPNQGASTATVMLANDASISVTKSGVTTTYTVGDAAAPLTSNSAGFVFSLGTPPPSLDMDQDTGYSSSDWLTNDSLMQVYGLVFGTANSWEYQVDGGSWQTGTGVSFVATSGVHSYSVRQINVISESVFETTAPSRAVICTVDLTPPQAPTLMLANDSGWSASDGITSNPTINVLGLETAIGTTWQYQVDGTAGGWIAGTGTSFTASSGAHSYFVQQIDAAGNVSTAGTVTYILDTTAPTVIGSVGTSANVTENDLGAVTLAANTDVRWSLGSGADSGLFSVTSAGVLSFKSAPNYEMPRGSAFNVNNNNNTYKVFVVATDVAGNASAPTAVVVNVSDVNEAPVVFAPTPNQVFKTNQAVNLNVAMAFRDQDILDTGVGSHRWGDLTYTATGLPNGLSLSSTGIISGAVTANTASAATITVTATDGGGLSVTETFGLSVLSAPALSNFTVSDSVGNPGFGKSGDTLTFTVNMSEAVTVSGGTPSISFNMNGQAVTASYVSGSGSSTLIFMATAPSGNGSAISVSAIDLNGATVLGVSDGQPWLTTLLGQSYSGYTVDNTPPTAPTLSLSVDSGSSSADGITSSATINVSGLEAGAGWQYRVDTGAWQTGTGNSFTASVGAHSYFVQQTDLAGNISTSSTATYTLDTSAPMAGGVALTAGSGGVTVASGIDAGTWYNAGDVLTVTLTVNEAVLVTGTPQLLLGVDGVVGAGSRSGGIGLALANPIQVQANYVSGSGTTQLVFTYTVQAGQNTDNGVGVSTLALNGGKITDLAGNNINLTVNVATQPNTSFKVDTNAPSAPSLALANDTGFSANDGVTNNAIIQVTGLEAGSIVNGLWAGTTWYYQVDGGSWTLGGNTNTPPTGNGPSFMATSGTHTYSVLQVDEAGNTGSASTPVTYTLDTTPPLAPSLTLASDTGSSASDGLTNNPTINVVGLETTPGTTWQYQVDSTSGTWLSGTGASFIASNGAHSYFVRQTDAAGNVGAVGTATYTLDTTAPIAPSLTLASDTGSSTSDGLTNNPTINVVGLETTPGTTWQYQVDGTSGTWLIGTGASFIASNGPHSYFVRQTDAAGNVGAVGIATYTLDTTSPLAPSLSLVSDTGDNHSDGLTNNSTINVTGLAAGTTWQYQVDAGAWQNGTGNSFIASNGVHSYSVQQTDLAGNTSAILTAVTYTLDTSAPVAPTLSLASDTGFSTSDGLTSNPTINVLGLETSNGTIWQYQVDSTSGTWLIGTGASFIASNGAHSYFVRQIDTAGNVGPVGTATYTLDTSAPATPTLSLASDTGANHSDGLTNNPTINVTGLAAGTTWQYQVDTGAWQNGTGNSFTASDGVHSYSVQQTDLAGNTSAILTATTYTLDTSAPVAPTLSLVSDTGVNHSDGLTNNPTVNVIGLAANATWQYQVDGGAWQPGTGSSFIAMGGAHSYFVQQTDLAGNTSPASTAATYTLDTSAPVAPTLSLASDTGANHSDGLTSNPTVNVIGLEAGAGWQYRVDGGAWQPGTGSSFIAMGGAHSYSVQQTDLAGNTSPISTAVTYTLDTSVPTGIAVVGTTGNVAENTTGAVTLTANANDVAANASVTWSLGTGGDTGLFNLTNGVLSFKVTNKPNYEMPRGSAFNAANNNDTYTVYVIATDAAGNASASTAVVVNVTDINEAPVAKGSVPNQTATRGVGYSLNVSGYFSDPDSVNTYTAPHLQWGTLTYTTSNTLPSGLTLSSTGVISGTATSTTASAATITVTATDGDALSATQTFTLGVINGVNISHFTVSDSVGNSQFGKLGDTLTFTVTMSEAVDITGGTPSIDFNVNGQTVTATYSSGTGSSTLVFTGAAPSGNGSAISVSAIHLNSATVVATANSARNWDTTILNPTYAGYTLDNTTPMVSSIALSSTTDNTPHSTVTPPVLGIGDVVTATVTMSEAVTVTGTPQLNLTIGATTTVQASYAGGSGTSSLTFTYVILTGQNDSNGIRIPANALSLNGGSVQSLADTSATLTASAVIDNTRYLVDTTPPTAPILALASDTGSSASDHITSNATISVTGLESGASWQYQVDGAGAWVSAVASGTSATFIAMSGAHSYLVRQIDLAGNTSPISTPVIYTLDTSAPATPTLNLAVDSGSSDVDGITNNATINVSGLEVGATWQYQVDASGTWASAVATATTASFTASGGAHSYTVQQTDLAGNTSPISTAVIYRLDTTPPTAPTLSLASDTGTNHSDNLTNNATISVTGLEVGATWQYKVDASSWQAGTGSSFTASSGAHSYFVQQTDLAGNTSPISTPVIYTLDTSAPSALALSGGATSVDFDENRTSAVGTLTANANDVAANASVTWSLGTGADHDYFSLTSAGVLSFIDPPNYESPRGSAYDASTNTNAYTVNVNATDAAGNTSTRPIVINVQDVNESPTLSAQTPDQTILTDDDVNINLARAFSDPDSVNTYPDGHQQWGTLTYAATGLPNGLSLSSTGLISGRVTTPQSAMPIVVTATDGGGLAVTETFNLRANGVFVTGFSVTDKNGNASVGRDGDLLTFAVTLSETASILSAFPRITFNINGQTVEARMIGNVSGILSFTAYAPSGDGSTISLSSINLNGASVNADANHARSWDTSVVGQTYAGYTQDNTPPLAPTLMLASDNGANHSDGITSNPTINVGALEADASWQYQVDTSGWINGTGNSFTASSGAHSYTVQQTDLAGNTGPTSTAATYTLGNTSPMAPRLALQSDASTVMVSGLEDGGTWQYQLDGTAGNWTTGTNSSFIVSSGTRTYFVRQTDLAGNVSVNSPAWLVDKAVDDNGDTVTGSGAAAGAVNVIAGGSGADTLNGGSGVNYFFGGAGNDIIVLSAHGANNLALFGTIDGGDGIDTLRLQNGISLDFTNVVSNIVSHIERIDLLTDTAANTLTLSISDVLSMAGINSFNAGSNGWTNATGSALDASVQKHQLVIDGLGTGGVNADVVNLNDTWAISKTNGINDTVTGTGSDGTTHTYYVYNASTGSNFAQLLIDRSIALAVAAPN